MLLPEQVLPSLSVALLLPTLLAAPVLVLLAVPVPALMAVVLPELLLQCVYS